MAGDQSAVFLVLVTNQETGAERFISDDGVTRTWTDPATAAQAAKELNDWAKQHNMLDRYRVIKEGQTKPKTDWRERERQRFLSGKYLHPVWVNHDWARAVGYIHHFCHVALDDPSFVAYTPDEEYGEADKQLRISPEGYLKKYAGNMLGSSTIQQLATDHLDKYGPQPELLWAHTSDEIERIYLLSHSTVSSCMTHEKSYFSSSVHPVRVFGAGDLALAYLMSADGKTVASRVLCWPAQRKYGRLFGRERRIRLALQKLGYTEGNFQGARLLKIEDGDGNFVCPYLDYHDHVSLGETHLIINGEKDDGERMRCDSTNGQVSPYRRRCFNCGDSISQGDEYRRRGNNWCETCYTEHFTYCDGCHEDVDSDDTRVSESGDTYCSSCWSERFVECHQCGDETDREDAHEWRDNDYCEDCYSDLVTVCDECQTRIDRDDAHEHNDQTLCGDCRAMIETSEEEEQANSEPEHSAA